MWFYVSLLLYLCGLVMAWSLLNDYEQTKKDGLNRQSLAMLLVSMISLMWPLLAMWLLFRYAGKEPVDE